MNYKQAFKDHQYLWNTYGPAQDMTGAYVDSDDLHMMLSFPTKNMAKRCLVQQIQYWFEIGPDTSNTDWTEDPEVSEIATRHFCSNEYWSLIKKLGGGLET